MAERATKYEVVDIEVTEGEEGELDFVFFVDECDDVDGFDELLPASKHRSDIN